MEGRDERGKNNRINSKKKELIFLLIADTCKLK